MKTVLNNAEEEKPQFVTSFIINKEAKPVILKRKKDLKLDSGMNDLLSGHIEKFEIPYLAIRREAEEELNISKYSSLEVHKLGIIKIYHPTLKRDIVCEIYCIYVESNIDEININIIKANNEIERAEELETFEDLFDMIRKGKTRFKYTEKMEKFFEKLKDIEKSKCSELEEVK